jgi:putative transposase
LYISLIIRYITLKTEEIDGGKMIKGRKRHIITDTMMGLLLAVIVHAANVQDSKGATDVIALLKVIEDLVKTLNIL